MDKNRNKNKVCIRCATFNHSRFIEDALNGFVMQETDFPFVAAIVDDASTDGESQVLRDYYYRCFDNENSTVAYKEETEYGTILYAQHKVNKNCHFAIVLLKENHFSQKKSKLPYYSRWSDDVPYIALCEGDDYWTDPLKLQKQVNYLENHSNVIVCSHDFIRFFQDTLSFEDVSYYHNLFTPEAPVFFEYSLENYFDRWWTQPLTCVYRNGEYLQKIPSTKYNNYRDDIFFYYLLKEGKGVLLKDQMGVYRIHHGGVWSGDSSLQRFERAFDNAYSIYLIEKDDRAFTKINREELRILQTLFNQHSYVLVIRRLLSYKKLSPKEHYLSVVNDFKHWLVYKIKRKLS